MSSVRFDTCNFRFCPPEQALLSLTRNILWFYYTDQKFWSNFAYLFDRAFLKLCRCFIQTEITISMSGVALSHPMFVFSGERLLKLNFVSALRQKNAQICDLNRRLGLCRTKKNERFFSYSRHISYWGIGDFVPLHSVRYVSYASLHLLLLEALDTFQFYMCAEEHHLIIKYGQFVLVFEWNPDDFVELRGQILRLLLNFWFVWKSKRSRDDFRVFV